MARRLALSAVVVALLLVVAASAHAARVPTVRVGFATPLDVTSMVGFVHGMDLRRPGDDMIEPLSPTLWRGKLRDVPYDRVQEVGGRYTYVLSDRWGYPGVGQRPPYEDFKAWERFVRKTARGSRRGNVLWDIWNEPNEPWFWQGTPEQLYETYRIAENVLRQELGPDVLVGGLSTLGWRSDWVTGLLEWCRTRGCQVNMLSWHELTSGPIPAIEDRLEDARETFLNSSAADQYRPGEVLGVMHYLEAGGADAAARTCWDDLSGESNCYNDTLDGLLVPGSFEPRSAWWATKAYADGADSRVLTRFSDPHLVGFASSGSDTPRTAQLLIAHTRGHGADELDVRVTLRHLGGLGFLRGERRVGVRIRALPRQRRAPIAGAARPPAGGRADH